MPVFPYCVTCCLNQKMYGILQQEECVHSDVREWQSLEKMVADEYNKKWDADVEEMEMVVLFQTSAILSE